MLILVCHWQSSIDLRPAGHSRQALSPAPRHAFHIDPNFGITHPYCSHGAVVQSSIDTATADYVEPDALTGGCSLRCSSTTL